MFDDFIYQKRKSKMLTSSPLNGNDVNYFTIFTSSTHQGHGLYLFKEAWTVALGCIISGMHHSEHD